MRFPQILVALSLLSAALVASAQESFQSALQRGAAAAPAQYSFADMYRLAVAAPAARRPDASPVNITIRRMSVSLSGKGRVF